MDDCTPTYPFKPGALQIPSSLQNIYKEIRDDVGCEMPQHGHLESWVVQGVLLLNTSLTVEVSVPPETEDQICVLFCVENVNRTYVMAWAHAVEPVK